MRDDRPKAVAVVAAAPRVAVGWRLAAAGGLAGALTNCALFPLDTVKTLRQADPARFPGALPAARDVLRRHGLAGLYAGVSPALVGSALSSALYFGTYELVRRRMRAARRGAAAGAGAGFFASPARRIPGNALAAACGNIASSLLFVPKEVVKQRMQAGVDSGQFVRAARTLVRVEGLQGLYRGYKATLLRNIPSTMLRFVLYEEAKLALAAGRLGSRVRRKAGGAATRGNARRGARADPPPRELATLELVGAGAASGAVASAITTPMDVIKTTFATGKAAPGAGIFDVAATIVKERGVGGLYVGIRPRVLWSGLFAAVGFSTYELCKAWLAPKYNIIDAPAVQEAELKPRRRRL